MRFSSTAACACVLTLVSGAFLSTRSLSGDATYYGGNVAGGTCSFSTYKLPAGIFGTALSDSNWDGSANCGACVSVTGPSGESITAMIVDECPNCGLNHLDLFPDAFAALANPTTGVIAVGWEYIDCPITSALQVHNKEGVSAYWFSMQVVNANKAVASLEVSTDDGRTWQSTTRATYNFFENSSGFGTSTVDVKITSVDGDVVIVNDVAVTSDSTTTASGNFGNSGVGASVMAPITSSSSIALASTSIDKVSAYTLETSSSTRMAFSPSAQTPAAASTSTPVGGSFQQTSPVLTSFSTSTTAGVSTAATPSPSISEMFAATLPSSAPGVVYVYVNACPA